ncbi:MAG: 1-acyl-sn-glycerol-3-phosphate acyltransferase [Scytonematopsis contorta HA4267-MV1]|nr:1-acyl-sn-glycerol-3-phosphate acyltransferase [Scytonematopsis contorta HA4267-MV1]
MSDKIDRVQPPLEFIPPRFNPFVLKFAQWTLPIVLRFRLRPWLPSGITQFEVINVERLVELYQKFQAGKIRFLMAFRHPETDDPLSMLYLLSRAVPQTAHKLGINLQKPIHSHFMYERGMTLWAGDWLGSYFSGLGGFPIRRGKALDKTGLKTARTLFVNAKYPIAVAPEGATNGHSGIVGTLEPGVAQLGFWCAEDLLKADRQEEVFIVPITIQYSYVNPPWDKLNWLLTRLETDSGLGLQKFEDNLSREEIYHQRLLGLAEYLVNEMEEFYQHFYKQNISGNISIDTSITHKHSREEILTVRLQRLLNSAFTVAEEYFHLPAQGSFIDRCRRLEEAGWSRIYREDLPELDTLPPFKRGLADWIATEADLQMRHMRLAETFVTVTTNYVQEKPTPERFAEMTLLIFDMMSRIKDTKLPGRPRLGWRKSTITVGEPINVSSRISTYQADRHSARLAVTNLTQDLHQALKELIGNW